MFAVWDDKYPSVGGSCFKLPRDIGVMLTRLGRFLDLGVSGDTTGFRGWEGTDREETKGYRTYCRLRGWEGTEREGTKGVLEDISGDAKGVSGDTAGFRGCIGFWLSWVGVINERWFDDF